MAELTEHEWLLTWTSITNLLSNYERAMEFETEDEKKKNDKFRQELRDLSDKIHPDAFPLLNRVYEEQGKDISELLFNKQKDK